MFFVGFCQWSYWHIWRQGKVKCRPLVCGSINFCSYYAVYVTLYEQKYLQRQADYG